jgi:hypothetical protein
LSIIAKGFVILEVTVLRLRQLKVLYPILVTLLPIVTEVRPPLVHWNALSPILVTLLGIVTEVSFVQLKNALTPILFTLFGIVMEVRLLQKPKASSPMLVTSLGITVFLHPEINLLDFVSIIALQLFLLSYIGLFFSTTIEVRAVLPDNRASPILVTLLGIVMEVRPLNWNALSPILVTLFGIVMEVRLLQE